MPVRSLNYIVVGVSEFYTSKRCPSHRRCGIQPSDFVGSVTLRQLRLQFLSAKITTDESDRDDDDEYPIDESEEEDDDDEYLTDESEEEEEEEEEEEDRFCNIFNVRFKTTLPNDG
ncbi:hypothetical protein BGZ46_009326 [Entomortierella lignicola]|nr:hypothetical protein BGZ46_009326 [Entomortierella lignicola]